MKKSWFIRVFGWVAILLWGFGAFTFWVRDSLPQTPGLLILLMLLFGSGFGCFVVWVIGSVLWHAVGRARGQQQLSALAMLAQQGRAPMPPAAPGELRAAAQSAPGGPLQCGVCRMRAAEWFCKVHGSPVCGVDLAGHDSASCEYIPIARVKVQGSNTQAPKRAAVGSVFGL